MKTFLEQEAPEPAANADLVKWRLVTQYVHGILAECCMFLMHKSLSFTLKPQMVYTVLLIVLDEELL